MKKGLKRFLCAFLAVLMLCAALPMGLSLPSFAGAEGLTFKQKLVYSLDAPLKDAPVTFSATVKVKDSVAVPGVIFGNYKDANTSYVNFEVFENGVPGLSFTNNEGTVTTVLFEETDIRTGAFVNVTIVFAEGESVSLYLDGELVKTVATTVSYASDVLSASNFVVGGDSEDNGTTTNNDDNKSYFQGNIKDLALCSKALTASEVKQGVTVNNESILAYYDLTTAAVGRIMDLSENGCNASSFYQRYEEPDDYAYSFAIIGDMQSAVYADVNKAWTAYKNDTYSTLEAALAVQPRTGYPFNWIVDNKDAKKIEYVFGVGDLTEWNATCNAGGYWSWDDEFRQAKNQITKLDAAGIPYALVPGDHDEANRYVKGIYTQDGTRDYSKYNEHFADLLAPRVTGYYEEGNCASYYINFEVAGTKYMLLALEVGAPNRVLDWANEVVAANPDRRVIITTHAFMFSDGTRLDTEDEGTHNYSGADGENIRNNGEMMWDEFVKLHSNIVMVLSGHIVSSDVVWRQDKGVNGNTVTQILVNPQYMDASYGMVCMLYFSEDGNDVQVEWISTGPNDYNAGYPSYKVDYLYKTKNQFSFSLIEDGSSRISAYTDANAILSNKKLLANGLQAYANFNNWEESDTRTYFGNAVAANGKLVGQLNSLTYLNFYQSVTNSTVYLENLGNGNKAVKVVSSNGSKQISQNICVGNAYNRSLAYSSVAKNFAGQTFVYQTDYMPKGYTYTASNASTGIIIRTYANSSSNGTAAFDKTLIGYNSDGSVCLAGGTAIRDEKGNKFILSKEEFNTITLIVNPQVNKFWVLIDGKIASKDGYTLFTNEDMKKLVNANDATATYLYDEETGNFLDKNGNVTNNPVPYEYILSNVLFGHKGGASTPYDVYYDNTMLYFVDQTFTYEDYLDMISPVAGNTATLGNEIGYNYYLDISDTFLAENPNLEVKFEVNGKVDTFSVAGATVTDKDIDGDGKVDKWRKITCNVAAAEMTSEIKMTLYQGSTVYYTDTATVKEYADIIISGTNQAAANVAKSMLVYGAYAQKYFGVETDKPAIDVTGAELKDIPTDTMYGIEGTRFNYVASALSLQSETIICHYFDKVDGLTFTLNGEKLNAVADGIRYRVDIAVDAVNLDTVYALVVSDGTNSYTINYSAVGYAQQVVASSGNADLINLVKAMYTYNVYADAYAVS